MQMVCVLKSSMFQILVTIEKMEYAGICFIYTKLKVNFCIICKIGSRHIETFEN